MTQDSDASIFRKRFSCRSYTAEPVSRETVTTLLEAARWAPNSGNLQPWRFVVVTNAGMRAGLAAAAYGQSFLATAPLVVTICAVPEESARRYGDRGRELYCLQDTAAAAQNLLLAATQEGLASCWVGAFDETRVAEILDVPVGWRPVALIAVGYAAGQPSQRSRRPVGSITVWKI
jgi:nitroreductase